MRLGHCQPLTKLEEQSPRLKLWTGVNERRKCVSVPVCDSVCVCRPELNILAVHLERQVALGEGMAA